MKKSIENRVTRLEKGLGLGDDEPLVIIVVPVGETPSKWCLNENGESLEFQSEQEVREHCNQRYAQFGTPVFVAFAIP